MKKYEKPILSVIELQLKENIAAVPTTVYKGSKSGEIGSSNALDLALSSYGTGLQSSDLVVS